MDHSLVVGHLARDYVVHLAPNTEIKKQDAPRPPFFVLTIKQIIHAVFKTSTVP